MKKIIPIISFAAIILVVVALGLTLKNQKNKTPVTDDQVVVKTGEDESGEVLGVQSDQPTIDPVALAEHLKSQGAGFYGAVWCSHCKEQKELFGDAAEFLPYHECDSEAANSEAKTCEDLGVTAYPTWIINQVKYTGAKTLAELAKLSNFPVEN
jgi:thiol-disulfide isomerase/thioredoxin